MRNFFRSHFVSVVGFVFALPFAVWGAVVIAESSFSITSIQASPLDQTKQVIEDARQMIPWFADADWVFFSSVGGDADPLGVSFAHPPEATIDVLGPTVLRVTFPKADEATLFVGNATLLGLKPDEIVSSEASTFRTVRRRRLRVKRVLAGPNAPSWWTQEHTLLVIDRTEQERLVVVFAPDFTEEERFLDTLSWIPR